MNSFRRARVYVAGPMTLGDRASNIHRGIQAAHFLLKRGYAPFCPHLSHFWDIQFPGEVEHGEWLGMDFAWLATADALLRLPGESRGADHEEAFARERGIPIFYRLGDLQTVIEPLIPEEPSFEPC